MPRVPAVAPPVTAPDVEGQTGMYPRRCDSSAAASCSGRGRDTSLARMAAFSVIFIPGIGTLHRLPFPPRRNSVPNPDEIPQIPAGR